MGDYEGFWEQPQGALKEACKKLAQRTYAEVKKVAKWEGAPVDTLLNRIDIGIVPDESQMTTWLGRYCPYEIADLMGRACISQTRKLLKLSFAKGRKMPNAEKVKKLLAVLDERLGPVGA